MEEVKSPCLHICVLENGVCIGCKRTKEEISKWRSYSNEEKIKVIERIKNESNNNISF